MIFCTLGVFDIIIDEINDLNVPIWEHWEEHPKKPIFNFYKKYAKKLSQRRDFSTL